VNVFVHFPTIFCRNGLSLSIQASNGHYCEPRMDSVDSYTEVEIGYPSEIPPENIRPYCEDSYQDNPDYLNSVYAYVPIQLVNEWIDAAGGIDLGKTIAEWNKVISGKLLTEFPRR
jgi:hypothetical protein